jgi:hypothetical protein
MLLWKKYCPKIWLHEYFSKKLPKVNKCTWGENSPALVTLSGAFLVKKNLGVRYLKVTLLSC